jgi:flagellar protein FlaG
MNIEHTNNINQAERLGKRVGVDVPIVVVDASNKSPRGIVDDTQQPSAEQLKKATDSVNQAMRQSNQDLEFQFTMDNDTRKTVVKVVDSRTGELIRQIPSKEMLAIARSIDQFQNGLLLSQKA